MQRLSDFDIYRELTAVADRLEAMAVSAMSLRSRTVLQAGAAALRKLASAFYKASF
jgi:hypothetical protein